MNQQTFTRAFERLHSNPKAAVAQRIVADLIGECLEDCRSNLGQWEKSHIANALGALAWNIRMKRQNSLTWLRLALVSLEKALTPPRKRKESYGSAGDVDFSYADLKKMLLALSGEISD